jgi:hypothetical protein
MLRRLDEQAAVERERRRQAERFTGYMDFDSWTFVVYNASQGLVYTVLGIFDFDVPKEFEDSEVRQRSIGFLPAAAPGRVEFDSNFVNADGKARFDPATASNRMVSFVFTDAQGIHWRRDAGGRLVESPQSPLEVWDDYLTALGERVAYEQEVLHRLERAVEGLRELDRQFGVPPRPVYLGQEISDQDRSTD